MGSFIIDKGGFSMHEITELLKKLVFDVQREFYDERGKGARYRLTRIGVPYFEEVMDKDLTSMEHIKQWLINNGFCGDIAINEDEFSVEISVNNCCLLDIRNEWEKHKVPPLACPVANVFMYSIELKSGMAPELLPIQGIEHTCNITLAKMGTSDVLKEE